MFNTINSTTSPIQMNTGKKTVNHVISNILPTFKTNSIMNSVLKTLCPYVTVILASFSFITIPPL